MSSVPPRILPFPKSTASASRRAVIVTSYITGAPHGKNLGSPGYSYDFVVRLFAPLIEQWGELTVVPREKVDKAVEDAYSRGLEPIHLSFLPLQDVRLAASAPNVVVPAWEFPDIPDHGFDGNPQNNWVEMAAQCDLLIVGGPFTRDVFRRANVQTPIRIAQVPTPDEYFRVPAWDADRQVSLDSSGRTFSCPEPAYGVVEHQSWRLGRRKAVQADRLTQMLENAARSCYRLSVGRIVPDRIHHVVKAAASRGLRVWRDKTQFLRSSRLADRSDRLLDLSGIVYTCIFNPKDSRKNWEDLLTGFLLAMKDRADATLVLKLVSGQPSVADYLWNSYRRMGISHRCKVVFIREFLSDSQLIELAGATTYYITTTRAEGNCLPVMNYLAAGRPAISPCHTAIADYFGPDVGFVVESHPEPAAFPHDLQLRKLTSWHRLVWPSLVAQIRKSYDMAKNDRAGYERLSRNAREKMFHWCGTQAVGARLHEALASVASDCDLPAAADVEKPRFKAVA